MQTKSSQSWAGQNLSTLEYLGTILSLCLVLFWDLSTKQSTLIVTFLICLFKNIDYRLRKMEESAEQILSHLAVIHRFMSTHTNLNDINQGSIGNIPIANELRVRTFSETDTPNTNTLQVMSFKYLFEKKNKNLKII